MKKYLISNLNSGLDLGTYEGEDQLAAYHAMLTDAGYSEGDESWEDEIPAGITVIEQGERI